MLNTQETLDKIYSEWGLDTPMEALAQSKRRSREAREWSQFDKHGNRILGTWRDNLTKYQIQNILKITNEIGITAYSEDDEPDYTLLFVQHKIE